MATVASLFLLFAGGAAKIADLGETNFDKLVFQPGQSSLIKFFAPWCGHCKAMAPAWEEMAQSYQQSDSVLIGAVDCTSAGALCERFGIEGYPTVKLLQAGDVDLQEYSGTDMAFETLNKFAADNLKPACSAHTKEVCSPEQLEQLAAYLKMEDEERQAVLDALAGPLVEAEAKLKKLNEKLEDLEDKIDDQEEVVEDLKTKLSPGIRLLRSTLSGAATQSSPTSTAKADKDEP